MKLDAIVHDDSSRNMAAPIDVRFFGRDHRQKKWPVLVIMDDRTTPREPLVRPHPDDVRPDWTG